MNEQNVFTKQQLVSLVSQLISGMPNEEDPQPPGPWDPVIFGALRRTANALDSLSMGKVLSGNWQHVYGPRPEPWHVIAATRHPELWDVIGGGPLSWTALNPQPLPPKVIFTSALATEVINRAVLRQEIADMMPREGDQQGIIIVSGYIEKFVDEFCGTGFKLRFPIPVPPPPWFSEEISGMDLIVVGTQFQGAVPGIFNENLRQTFTDAAAKLIETGVSRI